MMDNPKTDTNAETTAESNAKPNTAQAERTQSVHASGAPKRRESRRPRGASREAVQSEFVEKVISINRVAKVTKGGKKLSFSALVVVGDGKGRVGYGLEKSKEVASSIKKALIAAKKGMTAIPITAKGATIPHQINGVCGAAIVMLKPALEGTGVIAAGPVRAVCDAAGIRNILTKCHKSNNPINVVKAVMDGLSRLKSPRQEPTPATEAEETQNAAS